MMGFFVPYVISHERAALLLRGGEVLSLLNGEVQFEYQWRVDGKSMVGFLELETSVGCVNWITAEWG